LGQIKEGFIGIEAVIIDARETLTLATMPEKDREKKNRDHIIEQSIMGKCEVRGDGTCNCNNPQQEIMVLGLRGGKETTFGSTKECLPSIREFFEKDIWSPSKQKGTYKKGEMKVPRSVGAKEVIQSASGNRHRVGEQP